MVEFADDKKEFCDEVKPKRNNATIIPMGGTVPICDYICFNKEHNIWRGTLVVPQKNTNPNVFFSRNYQPEINDLDKIFVEIEITELEILGVPFLLVPKEKLMFGYEKGSDIIAIPRNLNIGQPKHRQ